VYASEGTGRSHHQNARGECLERPSAAAEIARGDLARGPALPDRPAKEPARVRELDRTAEDAGRQSRFGYSGSAGVSDPAARRAGGQTVRTDRDSHPGCANTASNGS